ncbi:hypothetical protein Y1Q_0010598 [Alligator mississippiensis]|uniref:Ig-like domain-containing protein n=1 Tax=Alligator mississippiensis TaxID=8496 RepID=A0A151PGR6_ALLMI|nr:hypothetical protein Y1Q_0010598 [Alligator mississippiensis]
MVIREGDRSAMVCTYSGAYRTFQWYRQAPSGVITHLLTVAADENVTEGRFTGERLESGKKSTLHVSETRLGDSGRYFCAEQHGAVRGDEIRPEEEQVSAAEGDAVTLRCFYTTTYSAGYNLYWYRQHRDRALQYILYKGTKENRRSSDIAEFAQQRFASQADDNSTVLIITALERADTASIESVLGPGVMDIGLTLAVWVLSTVGAVQGDLLHHAETDVSREEGASVTLLCFYNTSQDFISLLWYRQYPTRGPQYILGRGARSFSSVHYTAGFAQKRFSSQADRSTTVLNITALERPDTALYYSALSGSP